MLQIFYKLLNKNYFYHKSFKLRLQMSETINKLISLKQKETNETFLKKNKKRKRSKKLSKNNPNREFDLNKVKNKLSKILEEEDNNK